VRVVGAVYRTVVLTCGWRGRDFLIALLSGAVAFGLAECSGFSGGAAALVGLGMQLLGGVFFQHLGSRPVSERLREAIEKADPTILAEVSQRFLHTKAGLDATDLLGTYHLDRGQYLMATLCYERLLARPDADKLSPKVLFKAALAYRRSGNVPASDKMYARLSERVGRGDMSLGKSRLEDSGSVVELGWPGGSQVAGVDLGGGAPHLHVGDQLGRNESAPDSRPGRRFTFGVAADLVGELSNQA